MLDRNRLQRFSDKPYRDSYLQTAVRGGIAYQIHALRERAGAQDDRIVVDARDRQTVACRVSAQPRQLHRGDNRFWIQTGAARDIGGKEQQTGHRGNDGEGVAPRVAIDAAASPFTKHSHILDIPLTFHI